VIGISKESIIVKGFPIKEVDLDMVGRVDL